MDYIECKCIEVSQRIGTFYVAAIDSRDLVKITFADVRRIEKEQRDIEIYLGIQRPLSASRVKEIGEYVNLVDASFPSSVILSIESLAQRDPNTPLIDESEAQPSEEIRNVEYDRNAGVIRILRDEKVAKVIDGQHRIEGLKYYNQPEPFIVVVTIFVDMDIEDQAMVFATINKTQTKVNKSLVYDLFDYAHTRSPQKTSHNIAKLLNERDGSPFYKRIKILGVADDPEMETLTQATFVESLMSYISKNPMADRNELKLGNRLEKVSGKELERRFFRNLFIEERDAEIAKTIWNYFMAVHHRWPSSWGEKQRGNVLNKSTGFVALMRFLKPAYLSFNRIGEIISDEEFGAIFATIDIADGSFSPERYKPGATGQSALYREFLQQSGLQQS